MLTTDNFGMPLLAPFAPLSAHDLKDSLLKYGLDSLRQRPIVYGSKNRTRIGGDKNDEK
jgi:hypothetical protein